MTAEHGSVNPEVQVSQINKGTRVQLAERVASALFEIQSAVSAAEGEPVTVESQQAIYPLWGTVNALHDELVRGVTREFGGTHYTSAEQTIFSNMRAVRPKIVCLARDYFRAGV